MEFLLATADAPTDRSGTDERAVASGHDLRMVEQLLERCWRELDASELNVKLTDIVRLLEIKNKLSPTATAEHTFWEMIDQLRREELAHFGEQNLPQLSDGMDADP